MMTKTHENNFTAFVIDNIFGFFPKMKSNMWNTF
jgi:hypothetical protein